MLRDNIVLSKMRFHLLIRQSRLSFLCVHIQSGAYHLPVAFDVCQYVCVSVCKTDNCEVCCRIAVNHVYLSVHCNVCSRTMALHMRKYPNACLVHILEWWSRLDHGRLGTVRSNLTGRWIITTGALRFGHGKLALPDTVIYCVVQQPIN